MTEEKYVRPGAQARELVSRTRKARLKARRLTSREVVAARRRARLKREAAHETALLPDGTSPKMRAALSAAKRRHDEDPKVQATLARAALSKRIQMAKEEAGISSKGEPARFLGMESDELEREVQAALPPPMRQLRPQKPPEKKRKASRS